MDKKSLIQKLAEKEKGIIEGFIMSFITGWFLTSLVYKTYEKTENVQYLLDTNKVSLVIVVLLGLALAAVIYSMNRKIAGCIMALVIFIYSILAVNSNPDKIYYALGMIIITMLAVYYVRDDILYYFDKLKVEKNIGFIMAIICGVGLIVFIGVVTVLRYKTYSNSTYDFGIFAQMFDNMKHAGKPLTSVERPELGQFSHFGVHFSPALYLMLPFYFIFSSPVTVQMMQAIVLGLAVIPLYLLCRHYNLSEKISVLMCALYCLIPATAGGTFYDFHENCMIPLVLFWLILAIEKKKNVQTVISALIFVGIKEDAAFCLMLLGLYFLISRRDKKRGIIITVASVIYFVIAFAIVHSYGIGDVANIRFTNVMYNQNGGLSQIIITILSNPAYIVSQIMAEDNIKYMLLMLLPVSIGLIQNKKYSRYILLGSFVLFNLISNYQYSHDIGFQYNYGVIVFMLYICIMTASEWDENKAKLWSISSVAIAIILFVGFAGPKWSSYKERYDSQKTVYNQMDELISLVPKDASILTSGFIMPHFYYAKDVTVIDESTQVTQDYVVVDLRSGYSTDIDIVQNQLQGGYNLVKEVEGTLAIYEKNK